MQPRIIFMGTPAFAVPALRAVHETYGVVAVVTIPDKPQGRGLEIRGSDVKIAAEQLGITRILQPTALKDEDFIKEVTSLEPDIMCVIAFRILPRSVYTIPTLGAFNVHASLLPKFRGAAPINHAIMRGEHETGVTSFLLNDVVDTGNIITQRSIVIGQHTTAGELYEALMPLAAVCAADTCRMLLTGTAVPMPQTPADPAFAAAPKVFRETSGIDWEADVEVVRNFIRGLSPLPCAWTLWNDGLLKIYKATASSVHCETGTWKITDNTLIAGAGNGALSLDEIQLPGKKRIAATEFLRGYRGAAEGSFA